MAWQELVVHGVALAAAGGLIVRLTGLGRPRRRGAAPACAACPRCTATPAEPASPFVALGGLRRPPQTPPSN